MQTVAMTMRLLVPGLAAMAAVAPAAEMQVRDIRVAVGWQGMDLDPSFSPQGGRLVNGYTAEETAANRAIFTDGGNALAIGLSTTNGLLDQHGGLLWKLSFDLQRWERGVDGTMVGKAGSLTRPRASYQLAGVRTHLGWGYAFTDYLHAEALPFVGAGSTELSFPAWAEEYTVGGTPGVVGYWVQPTGRGWYAEAGLQTALLWTLPSSLQAGLTATWAWARSRTTVNGWQYRDPAIPDPYGSADGAWVTDEADVAMRSVSLTAAATLGWRF